MVPEPPADTPVASVRLIRLLNELATRKAAEAEGALE
jgi:hypothetical protein